MLTCPRLVLDFYSMRAPKGAMPFVGTVFGNSPEPQIMNECQCCSLKDWLLDTRQIAVSGSGRLVH
jgi:hypothetical protein